MESEEGAVAQASRVEAGKKNSFVDVATVQEQQGSLPVPSAKAVKVLVVRSQVQTRSSGANTEAVHC